MNYECVCPYCDSSDTVEESYEEMVRFGRRKILVSGLQRLRCSSCESEFVPAHMHDFNLSQINKSSEENRGAVSVWLLRRFREMWALSQKDASAMFGAGKSSFAKWESGQAKLSTPSALLVQLAWKFPEVVPHLAKLSGTKLSEDCEGLGEFHQVTSWDLFAPRSVMRHDKKHRLVMPPIEPHWSGTYATNDSQMLEAA